MRNRSVTKKPKLTKWFDGSVKPVRDGVYERLYDSKSKDPTISHAKFKNGIWLIHGKTLEEADRSRVETPFQDLPWRGLAQKPEVQP